jgi:membrane-bound lytic murein transglycosylase D
LARSGSYGIELGWPESPEWTRIKTERAADLGLLAELSGVDASSLRVGNSELHYGVTPPDADYLLKVPVADAPALQLALARKDVQFIRYYFHPVRSGDTLSALSRHYGVSVDLITRSNPGLSARYLKIGARILVPALKEVGPYVRAPREAAGIAFEGQYTVKKGETLWSIALGFDVDPELLAEANGMDLSSILREGRIIKTPIIKSETL